MISVFLGTFYPIGLPPPSLLTVRHLPHIIQTGSKGSPSDLRAEARPVLFSSFADQDRIQMSSNRSVQRLGEVFFFHFHSLLHPSSATCAAIVLAAACVFTNYQLCILSPEMHPAEWKESGKV